MPDAPGRALMLALAALQEIADAATHGPIPPSLPLRAILAMVHARSNGDMAPYREFWRLVLAPDPPVTQPGYLRATSARAEWTRIVRTLGIEPMDMTFRERLIELVFQQREEVDPAFKALRIAQRAFLANRCDWEIVAAARLTFEPRLWATASARWGMCNRARNRSEPEAIFERFGATWAEPRPMDNRFNPVELAPRSRVYVVRQDERGRGVDVMGWDVLGGQAAYPMTNVRNLALPQWRRLAETPEQRCLVPLTEFCEWTPDRHDVGGGKPIKGEMWFAVTDQPLFAVAGFHNAPGASIGAVAMPLAVHRLRQQRIMP